VRDWEPAAALFADREGMEVIEALVPQAAESLRAGGLLAMEVDSRRAERAAAVVNDDGRFADIGIRPDLTGRPRFVAARRKER
jgi:release factor glutamine methyltransferase